MAKPNNDPYRWERVYSNGCQCGTMIWNSSEWIADVVGAPCLGSDSVNTARRIVAALNACKGISTEELETCYLMAITI